MKTFNIAGAEIILSDANLKYNFWRSYFSNNLEVAYSKIDELHEKCDGIEEYIIELHSTSNAFFSILRQEAKKLLINEGIYDVSIDEFYSKYYFGDKKWYKLLDDIQQQIEQVHQYVSNEELRRKFRKGTRSKVVGGGFGISGAIQGIALAGTANFIGGLGHSIFNAFGNSSTRHIAREQLLNLFESDHLISSLKVAIREAFLMFPQAMYLYMYERKCIEYIDMFNTEMSVKQKNIINNIEEGLIPNEKILPLIPDILRYIPYYENGYKIALELLGDSENQIGLLALENGINLSSIKNKVVYDKLMNKYPFIEEDLDRFLSDDIYSPLEMESICKYIDQEAKNLAIPHSDPIYTLLATIYKFKCLTLGSNIHPHQYDDIYMAEKAYLEYLEMINIINESNDDKIKKYLNDNKERKYIFQDYKIYHKKLSELLLTFEGDIYSTEFEKAKALKEFSYLNELIKGLENSSHNIDLRNLFLEEFNKKWTYKKYKKLLSEIQAVYFRFIKKAYKKGLNLNYIENFNTFQVDVNNVMSFDLLDKRHKNLRDEAISELSETQYNYIVELNNIYEIWNYNQADEKYIDLLKNVEMILSTLVCTSDKNKHLVSESIIRNKHIQDKFNASLNLSNPKYRFDYVLNIISKYESNESRGFYIPTHDHKTKAIEKFASIVKKRQKLPIDPESIFLYFEESSFSSIGVALLSTGLVTNIHNIGYIPYSDIATVSIKGLINRTITITLLSNSTCFSFELTSWNTGADNVYNCLKELCDLDWNLSSRIKNDKVQAKSISTNNPQVDMDTGDRIVERDNRKTESESVIELELVTDIHSCEEITDNITEKMEHHLGTTTLVESQSIIEQEQNSNNSKPDIINLHKKNESITRYDSFLWILSIICVFIPMGMYISWILSILALMRIPKNPINSMKVIKLCWVNSALLSFFFIYISIIEPIIKDGFDVRYLYIYILNFLFVPTFILIIGNRRYKKYK